MISARMYIIVFCTCDVISLVVQAIGGAKASLADTDSEQDQGTHIMVAGIAFQLFTMTIFGVLGADFLRRAGSRRSPLRGMLTRGMRWVLGAMLVSFLMIYVRSVYRTIELAQGWTGYLITHEVFFIVLDAAIMVVAVAVFVPVDPALLLRGLNKPGWGAANRKGSSPEASDAEIATEMGRVNGQKR